MKIQDAYDDWSATYDLDRNLTRDLDESITRDALATLSCQTILEVGCGTGKNTALLAQIGRQVVALDFSLGMIEQARAKHSSNHVAFAVADITQPWPCDNQAFDLVVCNLVLEHVADLPFIFSEAARVLLPAERLFVSELHPFRQYQGTQANFRRKEQTTMIPAFVHHISDFIEGAAANELELTRLKESWHPEDQDKPPRLISFMFEKRR
jgi:malonyl-CoA O-methyltransferase